MVTMGGASNSEQSGFLCKRMHNVNPLDHRVDV